LRVANRFGSNPAAPGSDFIEIRSDQLTAGQVRSTAEHETSRVRMRQTKLNVISRNARLATDGSFDPVDFGPIEEAVVEGED
jgi:hypothetical protein